MVGRLLVLAVTSAGAMFIAGIALKPLLPGGLPTGRDGMLIFAWDALLVVAMFTLVEELAFRGYAIGVIAERWGNAAAVLLTTLAAVMAHLRGSELPGSPGYALVAGEPVWLTGGALGLSDGIAVAASLALVTFLVFRPRRADVRPARV